MKYDLAYHKALDKSHILPNILNGGYTGVISQILSDFFISLLSYNEQIIIKDIQISSISSYYASVLTGMLAGFLIIYVDSFVTIIVTTIFYGYIYEILEYMINGDEITLTPIDDVFDVGVLCILLYSFDPLAKEQFLRYDQKRHFIEPTIPRRERNLKLIIFFSILSSTYSFVRRTSKEKDQ